MLRHSLRIPDSIALAVCAAVLAPTSAAQQPPPIVTFSIDFHGPTLGATVGGAPITEGDILRAMPQFGPLPPPFTQRNGGELGLAAYVNCDDPDPGTSCGVEL